MKGENMKLADTVQMMVSEDYKERFKAEYYQLVVRRNALWRMLGKLDDYFALTGPPIHS